METSVQTRTPKCLGAKIHCFLSKGAGIFQGLKMFGPNFGVLGGKVSGVFEIEGTLGAEPPTSVRARISDVPAAHLWLFYRRGTRFFRPRSKVGWPKSDFGCQSFEIRKSRFRGTGEKISGKIGLPEAAVCRGREKTLEINGTPMFVFPVSAKDCMIGAYLGVHTLRN